MKLRDWWLDHAPGPLWLLTACRPWSPWCLVDEFLHKWFPMTFGFYSANVDHTPEREPLCCRLHNRAAERWERKHHPEDFDE